MASFTIGFPPAVVATKGRVYAATAAKGGANKEEKGFFDWILGGMQKEDQILLETDPILKKVEEEKTSTTSGGRKGNSVAVPPKKSGGFGGLFAKK